MSCEVNPVKIYSLPLVKAETDSCWCDGEAGGGTLVLVFLGQEVKQKGWYHMASW